MKSLSSVKKGGKLSAPVRAVPVPSGGVAQAPVKTTCCAMVNTDIAKVESAALLWQVLLHCINTACPVRKSIEARAAVLGVQVGKIITDMEMPF
jgi:hypothetical protein